MMKVKFKKVSQKIVIMRMMKLVLKVIRRKNFISKYES